MGIYIPGLSLPKPGELITFSIGYNGKVLQPIEFPSEEILYFDNGKTATELPPHGRLGDLDAFESIKYELPDGQKAFNRGFHNGVQYVQRLIMNAPTIIPAEEE